MNLKDMASFLAMNPGAIKALYDEVYAKLCPACKLKVLRNNRRKVKTKMSDYCVNCRKFVMVKDSELRERYAK